MARQNSFINWRTSSLAFALFTGLLLTPAMAARAASAITEDRARQSVLQIIEVRNFDTWVRRQTHDKAHVIVFTDTPPTKEIPFWEMYCGEDHGDHTSVWYRFRVAAQTGQVTVQSDAETDSWISLRQWQKLVGLIEPEVVAQTSRRTAHTVLTTTANPKCWSTKRGRGTIESAGDGNSSSHSPSLTMPSRPPTSLISTGSFFSMMSQVISCLMTP
jgi:hypothetical protein